MVELDEVFVDLLVKAVDHAVVVHEEDTAVFAHIASLWAGRGYRVSLERVKLAVIPEYGCQLAYEQDPRRNLEQGQKNYSRIR